MKVYAIAFFCMLLIACGESNIQQLEMSGRVEGRTTTISAKVGGTVAQIMVEEGSNVTKDSVMVVLVNDALCARADAGKSNQAALESEVVSLEAELELLRQVITLEIEQAGAGLSAATAKFEKARAALLLAEKDTQRAQKLEKQKLISSQVRETAELNSLVMKKAVLEAEANQVRAEKTLQIAELGNVRITSMQARRNAIVSRVQQAEFRCEELDVSVRDLTLLSPISATVLTRNIEIGEQIMPGTTLFTLVDLNRLYLKVYAPETDIGHLTLQQPVKVYVDAFPDQAFAARISKIAQQAEFTPKNVETKKERVKLVYGVELAIEENPQGYLKPGMPADAVVVLESP
ncbi:MAG: efflux RND transporter periplasmic adaptor subunit [Pseudomonadales bacterium]|nr:efflux RND transporter periplasmic adaptor subunit [Pseudomonadales bacterium]